MKSYFYNIEKTNMTKTWNSFWWDWFDYWIYFYLNIDWKFDMFQLPQNQVFNDLREYSKKEVFDFYQKNIYKYFSEKFWEDKFKKLFSKKTFLDWMNKLVSIKLD